MAQDWFSMWPDRDSRSFALYGRALRVMPGGITRITPWQEPYPVYARSGEGCRITDVDGAVYVDFVNNFASLIHGHAHPAIVEAVTRQITLGTAFTMPTESEVLLAELLCQRVASFDSVRFCNSGSEAVMLAIKAARSHMGRSKIAKIEGAYHGMYDYAEVSLDPTPREWGNDPRPIGYARGTPKGVLDDVVVIPFNQPSAAARILDAHGPELAAVLLDVMPTHVGTVAATQEFLAVVVDAARRSGALLVLDEVISFRLGYSGGQGIFGLSPDLTVLAKIIGGGFPVGAVAGKAEVMAAFDHRAGKPLMPSSGTFTANPVTMTAGLASMQLLTPEAFVELDGLGDHARRAIARAIAASGYPAQVTGMGSIFQLHLHRRPISDYRSAFPEPGEASALRLLQQRLLRRGYLVSASGGGFLPTVMPLSVIDSFAAALGDELAAIARGAAVAPA
jgi:glutamate-1-semialdehyde 2,1-aminomutase